MSNAAFVLIAVGVIVVVSLLLWLLNRKPQTFMSSIDDFEREMKALGGDATRGGAGRQRRRAISPSARRQADPEANGATDPPGAATGTDGRSAANGTDGANGPGRATGTGPPATSGEPQP